MYYRIRLLLLSAFIVHLFPHSVYSTSIGGLDLASHAERERVNHGRSGELPVPSIHIFTNKCSKKHMRFLRGKKLDAQGQRRDKYSEVLVTSVSFGGLVYLQHAKSKRFICFNEKGKLKVKHSGDDQCVFEEISNTAGNQAGTYSYKSHHYENFYLGFNKGGKKMTGHVKRKRCYSFLKSSGPNSIADRHAKDPHNFGPNVDFERVHRQRDRQHRKRHGRHRKITRRTSGVT